MGERSVSRAFRGIRTMDGAGVALTRIFGFGDTAAFDPFLLLDHFGSETAAEYLAGFPVSHRGIDTVTYMQKGKVRHGDSIGNSARNRARRSYMDDRGKRDYPREMAAVRRTG